MNKDLKTNESSCPSCGATMRYSPTRQKLFCENCETCKDIAFEKLAAKHAWEDREKIQKNNDWAQDVNNLKCPNCGASVILHKLEYSKACPYCGSSLVGDMEKYNTFMPDGIMPFKFSNEEAAERYVKGIRKKHFVPNAFKKAPPTENIKGIYIPVFGFDANTHSTYKGTLATDTTHTDSKGRSHTTTSYQYIKGEKDVNFTDILVETSSKLNQIQLQQIEPYNTGEIVKFNQGFIMGYTVEQFETNLENCKKISENIMKESIKKQILAKYHYDRVVSFEMNTNDSAEKFGYYLMPTYKCDYEYKNKHYTTFMNGQTGKVGGGYPKSPLKITLFVLFILLLIGGVIALFMALTK